ncbi:MAG: magnesium transporter CorA [Lachnospiraceae bacterium]|nr:magnesium transporter CorA [Lachnospiraceae bacterium]
MYYLIKEKLEETSRNKFRKGQSQYVAVLTLEEWRNTKEDFEMGIDLDIDPNEIYSTKAVVNYDSLTGCFSIPDRDDFGKYYDFLFALDEKGIVFIDDHNYVNGIIDNIKKTKKWRFPSLERFIYDFLEEIVRQDRELIERYEKELTEMEDLIAKDCGEEISDRANDIRSEIRDLRVHYEQLLDFSQELEENENNFFLHENLRYFKLFTSRIERMRDETIAVSDHAIQIRDIYKAHLDIKQNRIMTVLTIVTTVFMPLTVIAGWYGMNFQYMPELTSKLGYPIVIIVSVLIVVVSLIVFKLKKWL